MKNTFWAIKGEKGGFFFRNSEGSSTAIYTKRINRRWASQYEVMDARNNVLGWYGISFKIVEMEEALVAEHPFKKLPSDEIPELNSLVFYNPVTGKFYKQGYGFITKSLNTATHFPSCKEVEAEIAKLTEKDIKILELKAKILRYI